MRLSRLILRLGALVALTAPPAAAQTVEDMRDLSLGELADVTISSVSKSVEALGDAPAAVYVIRREDIVRSGARTIPEILRLAPNLQVAQASASRYVITARGLSGNSDAQNFANKLLVLIDGRSVYTPLFSGVYWDMQDVVPADIDRIEVVSGPGATLWGANAVNGVINIITRRASGTRGLVAEVEAGGRQRTATLRYGTAIGDRIDVRAYLAGLDENQTRTVAGAPAGDDWWRVQGGFRIDWTPDADDLFTLSGDLFRGDAGQRIVPDERIRGQNLTARWTRSRDDGSAWQVQAFYTKTGRGTRGGGRFSVDSYDLYAQRSFAPLGAHTIVAGGGVRAYRYVIAGSTELLFDPARKTRGLANLFVQDAIALAPALKLTLGVKLEDDPFSGMSVLPSARLGWKPDEAVLLWASAARAVRAPTPFDRDVVETIGGVTQAIGNPAFRTEKLTAFEAGVRAQSGQTMSISVSTYYNLYDDLRTVELTGGPIPLTWGNGLKGHSYGLEAWAELRPLDWWRLSAGFNLLRKDFRFAEGASGLLGTAQLGSDPRHQATLRSAMSLGPDVTLDADFRYVSARPEPRVPGYVELGGRLSWRVSEQLQLFVRGLNLLHERHQEYPAPAYQAPRTVLAGVQWRL